MHYIRIWSSRTGNVLHSSRESAFACLLFNKVEEVQHSIVIPSDSHSGINYPPFAEANSPPFSPERSFVLAIFPFVLTYRNLLSPTSQRLAVRPFSPERKTFEPLPLSIQIHSVRLRCLFSPRYLYLHQKMYIYYFMLYLAESLK